MSASKPGHLEELEIEQSNDGLAGVEVQPLEEDEDLVAATKKYIIAYPFKDLMS